MSEPNDANRPYSALDPDCVLGALESLGLRPDGRFLALNSYENRVYQVWMEEDAAGGGTPAPLVVKFYRPARWTDAQIREEHAFACELEDLEIPVCAPLVIGGDTLHEYRDFRFAVYPRRGGRAPELDDREVLEWIGRFLGRIHAVGAAKPFEHRPALDIASFGEEPREYLLASGFLPPELVKPWTTIVDMALVGVRNAFDRAGDVAKIRLHGDCHPGNILWLPDEGPHFVDLDDCRTGPAVQDLWMLLSGDRQSQQRQLIDLLTGYEDFAEFDPRELHLIEALRTLRLIHYSAWIARRWDDPAFPAAFPWFGTQRYWEERVLELREQVAAMDEPPMVV
jgi:Ser/Thr protein kinase RdoA (MazF antagonist)